MPVTGVYQSYSNVSLCFPVFRTTGVPVLTRGYQYQRPNTVMLPLTGIGISDGNVTYQYIPVHNY